MHNLKERSFFLICCLKHVQLCKEALKYIFVQTVTEKAALLVAVFLNMHLASE